MHATVLTCLWSPVCESNFLCLLTVCFGAPKLILSPQVGFQFPFALTVICLTCYTKQANSLYFIAIVRTDDVKIGANVVLAL